MKNIFILLCVLPVFAFSQKIKEDKKDNFTGTQVKTTDWLNVAGGNFKSLCANMRVQMIDTNYYVCLKLMKNNSVYSIDTDNALMFKLENDEVIKIYPIKFEISCYGCGAVGFSGSASLGTETKYPITRQTLIRLAANKTIEIRIYTSKGYTEHEIKKPVQKLFELFL